MSYNFHKVYSIFFLKWVIVVYSKYISLSIQLRTKSVLQNFTGVGCILALKGRLLLNTLKTLFRLSRVLLDNYLDMHSRLRYKICICLVIQGELNFSKLQGLQYYYPQNFRCKLLFYESENFSDSSLHHIVEFENFRFPVSTKIGKPGEWNVKN